jgi:predicted AlkP superfamily phosphohydrolase/phosphomutase
MRFSAKSKMKTKIPTIQVVDQTLGRACYEPFENGVVQKRGILGNTSRSNSAIVRQWLIEQTY